jgi:hypothetical protein
MSERVPVKRRPCGPAYDYRDHPEMRDFVPPCDNCGHRARWSIARPEEWCDDGLAHPDFFDWRVRAFACGQHLHGVLDRLDWLLDAVQIYDLAAFPEGGC